MNKTKLFQIITLPLVFILAACSSLSIPKTGSASAASSQAGRSQTQGQFNLANQPVENKLAIGILKMEGTPQAITTQQATTMLPLWQAVKSLSASNTTSSTEMQALYKQIEAVMTPDQVKTIQNLNMTQAQIQALFQQYGIQFSLGGSNLTAAQRATRVAQFQQNGGGNGGGGVSGAGGFGGGNGNGSASGTGGGTASAQRTPRPGGTGGQGGMNVLLSGQVVKVLQQRAGVSGS